MTSRPTVTRAIATVPPTVIWQPFVEDQGCGEPALLIQRDAAGLLIITQEGRDILIQPETLPALIKQLRLLAQQPRALNPPAPPNICPLCAEHLRTLPTNLRPQCGEGEAMPKENNPQRECWSADEENFNCESLDELLLNNDGLVEGDTVWKADAVAIDPASYISASDVTEMLGERAYDDVGEYAEYWPCVTAEATAELDALLSAWVHKHCAEGMTFYRVRNPTEYTLTAEDLA